MASSTLALLVACVALLAVSAIALDLSPSYGRLDFSNAGGQIVVFDKYPETAGFNLAAYEITVNPSSILFPGHYDTDTIGYVTAGSAHFGFVFATGKRSPVTVVKEGDTILLPREANFWFYNDGEVAFKFWGGGDASLSTTKGEILRINHVGASSILHGFTPDVLAAGFNVDEDKLIKIINAQHESNFAKVDGPLDLTQFPDIANGDHVEKYAHALVYHLLSEPPHFSIEGGGALYNGVGTYGEYPILDERKLSIELGVHLPGSVLGPLWGPTNHMIYYFTKGSGRYQIVNPATNKLAWDGQVSPGQAVAIPASYPFALIAGEDGVEYFTFADVSRPTGSSGYAAFLDYPKDLVAAAFNIPVEKVDSFVGKRDHNIILPAYKRVTSATHEM
eukprot:TRINITY_DN2771_c0_g1_i1.p2 TRINITY_DN2771_c0_g1~~TRINITY_DN2771_c0_g1_i1.p2  ORF type:complete len:427 (-),score=44.12 TRINITY_DN2771_c0_g1_i1:428-1600(-)